jgi:hypothetical protein
MVSADSWRRKRTVDFKAPSGDVYTSLEVKTEWLYILHSET